MNKYGEEEQCFVHPRELVTGVCALCLKERLSLLASTQQTYKNKSTNILSLMINPFDIIRHHGYDEVYYRQDSESSTSQEDSFISIKFEDNGVDSWDKSQISKISKYPQISHEIACSLDNKANKIKTVEEHAKPRALLRWRKRIGRLLHLIRWKRSASNMCHVGAKLEGAKVKHGWIRTITKRRIKD